MRRAAGARQNKLRGKDGEGGMKQREGGRREVVEATDDKSLVDDTGESRRGVRQQQEGGGDAAGVLRVSLTLE